MAGEGGVKGGPFVLGGARVRRGSRRVVDLPIAQTPVASGPVALRCMVIHGRSPGPAVWVDAALHGDEVNGVAVIRELAADLKASELRGTLILIPVVNVFGLLSHSRYLPDGRDLNRCFPGSARGSLGSRLAHLLMREVVSQCCLGIDLHTATRERTNLPQIRGDLSDPATLRHARAFAAPVLLDAKTRSGSLRFAAGKLGVPVLVYESGESLRFDPRAISVGVRGVRAVLADLDMLEPPPPPDVAPVELENSSWVRAPKSGILALRSDLGERVSPGDLLGVVSDPFGMHPTRITAPKAGLVIGRTESPLIYRGDALFHIGLTG